MLNRFNHLTADDRIIGTLRFQIGVVQTRENASRASPKTSEGEVERPIELHLFYLTNQIHCEKLKCKNWLQFPHPIECNLTMRVGEFRFVILRLTACNLS
jgi:hypothetical protein